MISETDSAGVRSYHGPGPFYPGRILAARESEPEWVPYEKEMNGGGKYMLNKKSVDDINVKGKKVLVRCDFNVPLIEGKITDENRLVAALPTIKKLVADGGKVILCSHLGKQIGRAHV